MIYIYIYLYLQNIIFNAKPHVFILFSIALFNFFYDLFGTAQLYNFAKILERKKEKNKKDPLNYPFNSGLILMANTLS